MTAKISRQEKSVKIRDNPEIKKKYSPLLHLGTTAYRVIKYKNKIICDIIIEGKSYTFENAKTTFMINKNINCN